MFISPLTYKKMYQLIHFSALIHTRLFEARQSCYKPKIRMLIMPIFTCVLLFGCHLALGQVRTTVFGDGQSIEGIVPYYQSNDAIESILLPEVDVEAVLQADREAGIEIPRFAVKISTNFSKADGITKEYAGQTVWKIEFRSAGATALNFEMDDLNLPEEAEMYVFNKAGDMVFGPVDSKVVIDNKFYTDVVKGDEAIIAVIMPTIAFESFTIRIIGVGHCFLTPTVEERDYNSSQLCEIDVNCPVGAGWSGQRDAVALIFKNGSFFCSGALVNDACQDHHSYFLTADHCVAGNNVTNWQFRFNYDSPNPVPSACRGSAPLSWITIYGSTLRANSSASDFALLELSQSLVGYPSIRYAGWNRNNYTPTSGVGIHHPQGDVKKISFTTGTLSISADQGGTGTTHLRLLWGAGLTEGGSSGSPLFDGTAGDWIVGQLHSHDASGDNTCPTVSTTSRYYGRFFSSWAGGGTSSTRLSNWLGAGGAFTDPATVNTIQSANVSGDHGICNTSAHTYTLAYSNPGSTITWTVSSSSLFTTSSGTGNVATLQAVSSRVKGKATLDFSVTTPCGTSFTVSYQIWVGSPDFPIDAIKGDNYLCTNQEGALYLDGNLEAQFATVSWSYYGALASLQATGNLAQYKAASTPGTGIVYATVTNACGTSSPSMYFQVVSCGRGIGKTVNASPNPSGTYVDIEIEEENPEIDYSADKPVLTIYDKFGNTQIQKVMQDKQIRVDVSKLKPDVYFIEAVYNGQRIRSKLIVTR